MKILYDHQIFTNQRFGGPSRYYTELIKELIKIKNEPIVISPINNNIYLETIPSKFKKEFFLSFQKNVLLNKLNNLISKYYFNKLNYDLYHLTYYDLCFSEKKPRVITVYDLIHEKFNKEFNFNEFPKREIFKKVDHFFCISQNTKKDLMEYYNIDESKISVTYLASSIRASKKNLKSYSKPFLLYVGSRKRYKNFRLLLEAYSKLDKIKKDFDIICFGGGKFLKEEINYIKELSIKIESIQQIEGSDEILSNLYLNATVLIYPSKYEGFGIPILEAMSLGCPVISSNVSSLPEVYGNAALGFSPNSSDELINCINKVVFDNFQRDQLIEKGLKRKNLFSWKKCAQQTNDIYKKLI
tara:strand:- start:183 stop:1250 length:1068 start_codon:yes stop_codon:yes gene_type:complete